MNDCCRKCNYFRIPDKCYSNGKSEGLCYLEPPSYYGERPSVKLTDFCRHFTLSTEEIEKLSAD